MRAVRLESKADTDGILVDVETRSRLPSRLRNLYGPEESIAGKRGDEFYAAHRYAPASAPPKPEEPENPRLPNLPPDLAHFRGRDDEEAALLEALRGDGGTQAITALKGIGGIGTVMAIPIEMEVVIGRYIACGGSIPNGRKLGRYR